MRAGTENALVCWRTTRGMSVFARKSSAKSKETDDQSSRCRTTDERACSSLTLLADARAMRNTHLWVTNLKSAVSSGSYGDRLREASTSDKSHFGSFGERTGHSPAKDLISAEISLELAMSTPEARRAKVRAER